MKYKKRAILLLVLCLIAPTSDVLAETVILHPGYINGTISLTGYDTVNGGIVDAYSLPDTKYDGHDNTCPDGEFTVTVEGGYDYQVYCEAYLFTSSPTDYYYTYLEMGRQVTYVEVGETVDMPFSMDPGYIVPIVTVKGGKIQSMYFTANTHGGEINYIGNHYIYGKNVWDPEQNKWVFHYLDGVTYFPMKPWVCYDANGDGDFIDIYTGDTCLTVYGYAMIDNVKYLLKSQFLNLNPLESTEVYWDIDVSSTSISGSINVENEVVSSYYIKGESNIAGDTVSFGRFYSPGTQDYYVNIPPATWDIYPELYFIHPGTTNFLRLPTESVVVPPNEQIIYNWDFVPSYVKGSIDLYGAYGNLNSISIYASLGGYAISDTHSKDYSLILKGGNWAVGLPYTYLSFSYEDPSMSSFIRITNNTISPMTIPPGTTISDYNFLFGTATITVNYIVAGGGELKSPKLIATAIEGSGTNRITKYAEGQGSNEFTTLGECTITVIEGTYNVKAYAYVEGSYTKFGEFLITVDPGDVIKQDADAPELHVPQPGGFEHIHSCRVEVSGTATDISEVASITVNGMLTELFSTNNPEDPNEVGFTALVKNLEFGENVITIEATDSNGNSITLERTVYRDASPPKIISITGPVEPVASTTNCLMTGVFTDSNIDDIHTAIWDWGDGCSSIGDVDQLNDIVTGYHEYSLPGVHMVTLTVADSCGESDTETWSEYLVIYDPSGGFVTGGGWIDSPVKAYKADPTLTGKANFGFVAKYQKSTKIPMGSAEFQFHAGNLNFHSDSFQWLVIAGINAKFKGTGTINGDGSYKFMITAEDGDLISNGNSIDKFRLKIWTENEVTGEEIIIYDNMLSVDDYASLDQSTQICGGSITIHT